MRIQQVKKGQQLKASTINKLIDATNINTPNEGRGSNIVKGGSGGWSLLTPEQRQRWEEPAQPLPWEESRENIEGVIIPAISKGRIYDGLNQIDEIELTLTITQNPQQMRTSFAWNTPMTLRN